MKFKRLFIETNSSSLLIKFERYTAIRILKTYNQTVKKKKCSVINNAQSFLALRNIKRGTQKEVYHIFRRKELKLNFISFTNIAINNRGNVSIDLTEIILQKNIKKKVQRMHAWK